MTDSSASIAANSSASNGTTADALDNNRASAHAPKKITEAAELKAKHPSKSKIVQKLLGRAKGASIAEIMGVTGWQPHSARAFLTGLRKKDISILRESRKDGETAYRIAN
jgi:hypothetical protein